jgi:uncharacterized phage protein gp47/JayE
MTTQPLPTTSPTIQIPSSIDYTSRDYMGFVQSLIIYASQAFPNWNIQSEGDFGVMILELLSYIGDINSFYTDRVQLEAYLPTATQRQSLLNIAQLLGYVPSNGTPATGTVTFITDNPGLAVNIPVGTILQANFNTALDTAVQFYTTTVETCPGNGGTVVVPVSQGIQYTMVPIGTSSGNPGQEFNIPQPHVLDGSVSVFVQSTSPTGTTQWSQVTTFINADNTDTVYTLVTNADFSTTIIFGDGINGLIPALGVQVYASYTIILGSAGNQSAGAVNVIVDTITGLSIQNINGIPQSSVMTGGSDPESNESIRTNAPISFATQSRAVSLQDFASLALNIPGVTVANAVANHSTSVSLYVLGPNVTVPTSQLQSQILTYFENATLAGVSLSLPTPNLIPVDVGSTTNNIFVQVLPSFAQQATVNAVVLALNALLTPPSTQFGILLNLSDIITAITAVTGVQYCIVPVFTREDIIQTGTTAIQFRPSEIPIAGNYFITANGGI